MDVKEEIKLQHRFDEIPGAIWNNGDDQQVRIVCVNFLEYGKSGFDPWRGEIVDK